MNQDKKDDKDIKKLSFVPEKGKRDVRLDGRRYKQQTKSLLKISVQKKST